MSGRQEVDCGGCGRRHVTSTEQARVQRVTRCECGQFVRLDRGLVELRSEPAPAPPIEPAPADNEEEDEATHMLSSLAAVAALRGRSGARVSQASMHEPERASRPVARSTLHSIPPSSPKHPSSPPGDKPLWYVDLGGSDMVEMTIEQLIVARRTGKLGEGALVWREGMPRWRPVGTLIPATSVASRSTPLPATPSRPAPPSPPPPPAPARSAPPAPLRTPPPPTRPPMPSRVPEALPPSLSYNRPLATLEFALEKAALPAPARPSSPVSSLERSRASRPPRGLTPVPRPAAWLASSPAASATSTSVAARLPSIPPPPPVPLPAPVPIATALPSPLPAPRVTPIPTPLPSFTSDRPAAAPENAVQLWLRAHPRAMSAGLAVLVCVTASGSGALLVRSLKLRHQPVATASALSPALPTPSAPRNAAPAPVVAEQPRVVDLQSLSVERPAHRNVRPLAAPIVKAPAPSSNAAHVDDSTDAAEDSPPPPAKPKSADLPSAAHANPYTTGSAESSADKKTAAGSDEPGL